MEDLQLVLSILGAIAIIAVLLHGFWSIRKQQPRSIKNSKMNGFMSDAPIIRDSQGFDADGIGEVRVRREPKMADNTKIDKQTKKDDLPSEMPLTTSDELPINEEIVTKDSKQQRTVRKQNPTIEPVFSSDDKGTTQDQLELGLTSQSSLFEDETELLQPAADKSDEFEHDNHFSHSTKDEPMKAQAEPEAEPEAKPEAKPKVDTTSPLETEKPIKEPKPLADPVDVLVLHVTAKEGEVLNGAELLPSLLSMNFKFGDMNIFHRHENNAGTGEILFSLANMVKPGVFDPDNMEQFSTEGVVLFMTLPCHGEPLMNFSIMLNSAHQLADDLHGELLDGERQVWTESTKQNYLQRIRALN